MKGRSLYSPGIEYILTDPIGTEPNCTTHVRQVDISAYTS